LQQYIFGYGSLIEQASRMRTTPAVMYVLPARVRGYARGWWARTGVNLFKHPLSEIIEYISELLSHCQTM
jgi:hypothetical protein